MAASIARRAGTARRGARRRATGLVVALVGGLGLAWAPAASAADHGSVVAWGQDDAGQVSVPDGLADVVDVAAGDAHGVGLRADGTVVAWGADDAGQATVPDGLTDVVDVDAGASTSYALRADGTVVGWGSDLHGEVEPPADLTDVVAVDGGASFALALRADGTVVGWGDDADGRTTPPADLTDAVAIAAGGTHGLALRSDGAVVAWGWDGYGQTDVPPDLTDVVAIGAGATHSLAVRADGTVAVWGGNFSGQADVPGGLTDVVAVDGGVHFSVARRADGSVVAWGEAGELTDVPAGLAGVTQVAAGGGHTLAVVGGTTDDTPPVIDVPDDVVRTAVSAKGARVVWPRVTAADDSAGLTRVRCEPRSGAHVDVGETTVTCTAADRAGNTATETFTVTLAYEWSGWRPPIEPEVAPVLAAGRTVPVRFELTGPSRWASAEATLWYAHVADDGAVGPRQPAAAPPWHENDGFPNAFRRSPWLGEFRFPWSTAGLEPGGYELSIDLGDDQERTARITLR